MDIWGAAAFVTTFALAVYDGMFTCNVMRKYGTIAETNPGVVWCATVLGDFGVYLATILPTAVLLTAATAAQSRLGLGIILGVRLCLFNFQQKSKQLQKLIDEQLKNASTEAPPQPPSDAL